MDTKLIASIGMGLLAFAVFMAVGYYESEAALSGFGDGEDVRALLPSAIKTALYSGSEVEKTMSASPGVVSERDLTYSQLPRVYYAKEFASVLNISVSFECFTNSCEATRSGVVFNERVWLKARVSCAVQSRIAECKIVFSDALKPPASSSLPEDGLYYESQLHKRISVYAGDEGKVLSKVSALRSKNQVEKVIDLWSGETYSLASEVITSVASIGVLYGAAESGGQYFYEAQQKYGLKYPDGGVDADAFVSFAENKARNAPAGVIHSKQSLEGFSISNVLSNPDAPDIYSNPDSLSGLVYRGFSKLLWAKTGKPLSILGPRLAALGSNDFREELTWLLSLPREEKQADRVHRALALYFLSKQPKDEAAYALVSVENQLVWLNATGEEKAFERLVLNENSRLDFSGFSSWVRPQDLSVSETHSSWFEREGDYLFSTKKRFSTSIATERNCVEEECVYLIKIGGS